MTVISDGLDERLLDLITKALEVIGYSINSLYLGLSDLLTQEKVDVDRLYSDLQKLGPADQVQSLLVEVAWSVHDAWLPRPKAACKARQKQNVTGHGWSLCLAWWCVLIPWSHLVLLAICTKAFVGAPRRAHTQRQEAEASRDSEITHQGQEGGFNIFSMIKIGCETSSDIHTLRSCAGGLPLRHLRHD